MPMKLCKVPVYLSIVFLFSSLSLFAQRNSFDRWYVNANVGPTVFIGDIRSADYFPSFEKPAEIGFAFGGIFGRELGDYFNVRSQLLYGSVSGVKPVSDYNFKSKFFGVGLGGELNLNTLFTGDNRSSLRVFGTFGASYLFWNANLYKQSTGVLFANDKSGGLAIPIGLKISYEVSPNLFLNLEGALHIVTSDMVDAKAGGISHDDINYNYVGITYKFDKKKRGSRKRKPLSRSQLAKAVPIKEEPKPEDVVAEPAMPAEVEKEVKPEAPVITQTAVAKSVEEEVMEQAIRQEQQDELHGVKTKGVDYRVSVLSSLERMNPKILQQQLNIPESITEKQADNGAYYYVVGNFDKMWKARELRNKLMTQNAIRTAKVVICDNEKVMSLTDAKNLTVIAQQQNADVNQIANNVYAMDKLEKTIPDSGLSFGVQFLSVKKEVYPIQALKDLYDIEGDVLVNRTGAWAKFINTGFKTLNEAVKAKEALRKKGFTDAFVVAFYNGKQIAPSEIEKYLNKK